MIRRRGFNGDRQVNIRDYSRALSPVLHARCKLNIAIPGRLYQAVCAFVFDIRSQFFYRFQYCLFSLIDRHGRGTLLQNDHAVRYGVRR